MTKFRQEVLFRCWGKCRSWEMYYSTRPTTFQVASDFVAFLVRSRIPLVDVLDVMVSDDDLMPLCGADTALTLSRFLDRLEGAPSVLDGGRQPVESGAVGPPGRMVAPLLNNQAFKVLA